MARLNRLLPAADYVIGALYFAIVLGSAGTFAWAVLRTRAPQLIAAPRVVAGGLLVAIFVFGVHLIPGILGVLSREAVAITALVALAIASILPGRPGSEDAEQLFPPARPSTGTSRGLGVFALAAVVTYALAHFGGHYNEATLQSDAATFHLSNIARWIDTGSLWQVDDFVYDRAAGNYPQTGDVFLLATILPWNSDFLVRPAGYAFVLLLAFAVYASCRELAASPGTSSLVSAAVVSMPAVIYIAHAGLADPQMLGTFAAGTFFLLRHWRTGHRFDLALAAIGLGLSLGTRWYAVFAVGAVLGAWLLALRIARRRAARPATGRPDSPDASASRPGEPRSVASLLDVLLVLAAVVAIGGFWLLRNLVESGNPVFPVRVAPLGIELFDAPPDRVRELFGFSLADYATRPGIYRDHIIGPFLDFMGTVSIALWAAIAAAGWLALRRLQRIGGAGYAPHVIALASCAAIIALAYLFTPYTAAGAEGAPSGAAVNARYVIPALAVGAPAVAWFLGRLRGRMARIAETVLALLVLEALWRASNQASGDVGVGSLLLAGLGVGAAIVLKPRAARLLERLRGRRAGMAVGAAAAALVMCLGGAVIESGFSANRYMRSGPAIDFVNSSAPSGVRIGLVGEGWVTYPMFGPRLGNEVEPVARRVDGMLRAYDASADFSQAVKDSRYDLVLVQEIDTLRPRRPLRQERWLREVGYVQVSDGTHPIAPEVGVRLYARKGSALAERARPSARGPGAGSGSRERPA